MLEFARSGNYDAALDRIASLDDGFCASDLVLHGRYILLSSGGSGRTPGDAQRVFERALTLEPHHVAALTELGWLHYSVGDDAETGKQYFEQALEVARAQMLEALRGAARCVEELHGADARNEFIATAATWLSRTSE